MASRYETTTASPGYETAAVASRYETATRGAAPVTESLDAPTPRYETMAVDPAEFERRLRLENASPSRATASESVVARTDLSLRNETVETSRNPSHPGATTADMEPSMQRQLLEFKQMEAQALLDSRDYKSAEPVIRDILDDTENLKDVEARNWTMELATILQIQDRWADSVCLLETEILGGPGTAITASTSAPGRSLSMLAEAKFQLREYETARTVGIRALAFWESEMKSNPSDKEDFHICIDLLHRASEATGRDVEARFYKSKLVPGFQSRVAMERQRIRDTEAAEHAVPAAQNSSQKLQYRELKHQVRDGPTELQNTIEAKENKKVVDSDDVLREHGLTSKDGINIVEADDTFLKVFESALKRRDEQLLAVLMKDGSVERRRSDYTALYYAIKYDNPSIVESLISRGLDINDNLSSSKDCYVYPLYEAIKYGGDQDPSVPQVLLNHGADPNWREHYKKLGYCPLHWATLAGKPKFIEMLLDKGANINAITAAVIDTERDITTSTALHIAASGYNDKIDIIRILCDRGAWVDVRGRRDMTPLHYAVARGHYEAAHLLIHYGADVNESCGTGDRAIHIALDNGYESLALALCGLGAELAIGGREETPLHCAVRGGIENSELIDILCKGTDINHRDRFGRTPLDLAKSMKQTVGANRRFIMREISSRGGKYNATSLFKRFID